MDSLLPTEPAAVLLQTLSTVDWIAVALFFVAWQGVGWLIEDGPGADESTAAIMTKRRREWASEFIHRENQVFDAVLLQSLQGGAAFFASTSLLGAGGLLAMMAQAEVLTKATHLLALSEAQGAEELRVRLLLPLGVLIFAFFKFAWSHRLFGYNAVLLGATPRPERVGEDVSLASALRAARINILAARAFNRALRAVYFALAAMAWLFGAALFIPATLGVLWMIHRREFRSQSRLAIGADVTIPPKS